MSRDKAIETPQKLLDLFNEYKRWVKENPFKVHDFVGKDATEVRKERDRPLTWSGFEGWLAEKDVLLHLGHYEQNTGGAYVDYLPIIRAIKRQCSASIIDGALGGIYNANIAARLEGLKEQSDVNLNDNRKQAADIFPDELDKPEKE